MTINTLAEKEGVETTAENQGGSDGFVNPVEHIMRVVRQRAPDAALRTDGHMFYIVSGNNQISRRTTTSTRAWRSAYALIGQW